MNKKGFILSELLAVVAILAIIVLVAVPTFNKYVFNTKDKYYSTLESSVKTAGMEFMSENAMFLPQKTGYYSTVGKDTLLNSGIIENVTDSDGKQCEKVDVVVRKIKDNKYEYETCLQCGDYTTDTGICKEIWKNPDNINPKPEDDNTGPTVAKIYISNKTTNSITINAVCVDEESGIKQYQYSIDGGKSYISGGKNSSYKFDNLKANQEFKFKVKCVSDNKVGSERETEIVTAYTTKFTDPTMKEVTTVNGYPIKGFSYSPERDVQVSYNDYNIESSDVNYFIRSTVAVKSNVYVHECINSGDLNNFNQNDCNTPQTKDMQANKWYKIKNPTTTKIATVTFKTNTDKGNHILYAQIGDEYNISGKIVPSKIITHIVKNIDVTKPTINVIKNPLTLNKQPYKFVDNVRYTYGFSGATVKCKETKSGSETSLGTGTYDVECIVTGSNGLKANTSFTVKHSYPPTWERYACNHYSCCSGWELDCGWCVNGAWGCCDPPCWGCCLQGTYCQDVCSHEGTCHEWCDRATCPNSGSYNGYTGMCEY